jgi:hypothetical protein
MPHSNDAMINSPHAMVLRELSLSIVADLHDMQSSVRHVRRSCARASQMFDALGIGIEETPVRDNLAVAEAAILKCQAIVEFGLDSGLAMMATASASASDLDPV